MRGRGSRAFLIGTIPVPGVPVMHPRFDPIWSAATDLGMVALLHVGYQPASFDAAWANTAGDMMLLRQLGVSQGHQRSSSCSTAWCSVARSTVTPRSPS